MEKRWKTGLLVGLVLPFALSQTAYAGRNLCWIQFHLISPFAPALTPKQTAARRLIDGLREDVARVGALVTAGKSPRAAKLADEFRRHMDNEDSGNQKLVTRIGAREMANPGIQEAVLNRFIPRVEQELAKLNPANRVQLLGWLSMTPKSKTRSGIYESIAVFDRSNPAFQFLAPSNELRNFGTNVSRYALDKLAGIGTVRAWEYVVTDAVGNSSMTTLLTRQRVKKSSAEPNVKAAIHNVMTEVEKDLAGAQEGLEKEQAHDRVLGLRKESDRTHDEKMNIYDAEEKMKRLEELLKQP